MYSCKPIIWQALIFVFFLSCLFPPGDSFAVQNADPPSSSPLLIVCNQNNPPFKFRDASGKSVGLLPDIWRLWSEKTGRQIKIVSVPWERTLEMVKNGEADIHAGLFFTPKRAQFLDYSNPLFNLEYKVFVHDTIRNIHSLKDLRGFRVGVPKGYTRQFMERQLPDNAIAVYDDFPDLFRGAMRDEVRIFLSPQSNYLDFLRHHGKKGFHRFFPAFSAYSRNYQAAVAKGNTQLLADINRGMSEISSDELSAVEQKWLMPKEEQPRHGNLRISMSSDYLPLTFLDEEGEPSGLLVDLWRLWSKKTGRNVIFIAGTWKESVDAVASGKADVHSGLIKNEGRSVWLTFSNYIYGVGSRFYFKADTNPVQRISDITSQKVGVVKGTWQQGYLRKHIPLSQIVTFERAINMVNALRLGQIDAMFNEDLLMEEILDRQRLRGRIYGSRQQVAMEHIYAGVAQKNRNLIEEINGGFDRISRAELLDLERRWIKDPTARFYGFEEKTVLPKLSESEHAWLSQHPHITVGGIKNWAPIDFINDDGTQQGITVDYLNLFEKRLGVDFQFFSELPWSEMLQQARKKKIDIVSDIVKTEKRSQYLRFSIPYFSCPYAIVSRRMDQMAPEKIEDFHNKTVAVERGYYLHSWFKTEHPEIHLLVVDTTIEALKAVAREIADAYIGNRAVSSWLIEEQQLQNLKITENSAFAPTLLRFGVRTDWPELVSILNKTLDTITAEEHLGIRKKWLGVNGQNKRDMPKSLRITSAEQAWLEGVDQIRLGVDANWAPLEYIDIKGDYSGFSSNYMDRFARQLDIKIAPVEKMTWMEVLEGARMKKLDVIPMINSTPEREKYFNFTRPYISFPMVIYTRQENEFISDIKDISDKRLATVRGFVTMEYLRSDYPNLQTTEFSTVLEALKAVSFGHVDAYIGSLAVGSYLIEREGLANLKIAAPTPYKFILSIGVRKDWPLLVDLFNRAIENLTETDRAAIRKNWLKVRYEHHVSYSLVWKILGGSLFVFILMLYRNVEINRQKRLLSSSEKQFKLLINALPIAIVVVDKDGIIIFDNSQAGHEIGDNKSLVGRNTREFYANTADRLRTFRILEKNGQVVGQHVKYLVGFGRVIDCLLSVIPIRFDGEDVLLGVTVNVTERIKMEQSLAMAKRNAEEADHLKSAFLASMSHELRTPLNSIIGFTGILLQELAGPINEEQKKQLSMVQSSSRHLLALINDVLDISKIEAGELKIFCDTFDIRELFEKMIETVRPLANQQGLALYVDIADEIGFMHSDERRVVQILLNLIGNSIKFTDVGEVRIRCGIENDFLLIDIKDTGEGIRQQDMDKLFRTFQQVDSGVDRVHEGTGLGLSISKKLVEKLGGNIQVVSEWGKGSIFTVRLPLHWPTINEQVPSNEI